MACDDESFGFRFAERDLEAVKWKEKRAINGTRS